jgi:hypothetical protein
MATFNQSGQTVGTQINVSSPDTADTSYSEYLPTHERPVITALLTALIAAGKTITINDGEEDIVTSDKITELRPELASTGEDYIQFDGGFFYLIYNNGSEDDPMIVIADYSSNNFSDDIWNALNDKYGE